ncbi:urea ABC transporter ATP-binding protein UrtD [Cellulosimicrobium funkei]|uniref:urea ABC transporter ATP-binding protein UrtD n=1 Tax=Cellulosimicrobium TaxID=157920 RepID=UPI000396E7DE|nr:MULTISPECIES: urea ABC transporter ATP-binding protein UrtD [Cellulosimicrobium]MCM3535031.1 urea ABC transporter ATP-binding protein UrtD [Cellulosimicrobium funkei]MDQ8041946.1 urea ABC transporter ATP-binding protein UrtD [Cellulosimicrobium sp. XJ-DQ-B-000]
MTTRPTEPTADAANAANAATDLETLGAAVLETGVAGDGLDLEAAQAVLGVDDSRFRHDYLQVRGLRVEFDGFVAVQGVDLTVTAGDLRFLIGPNGAGKTTIVDAITGLATASGSVQFGGVELLGKKTHRIARAGVGRTFQTASVFEELSVLQNLDIAAGAGRGPLTLLRRRSSTPAAVEQALETVGLAHLRDVQAGILAHGQKQWLEIGMLLVQDARLLLLDEPVAGMSQAEREQTGELLRRIGAQRTVVVVEHDMEFLRAFASSVTVLHLGQVLAEGTYAEVQADPRVQEVYLGSAGATRGARRRGAAPTSSAPTTDEKEA